MFRYFGRYVGEFRRRHMEMWQRWALLGITSYFRASPRQAAARPTPPAGPLSEAPGG